jgi:hypothetical protein
MQSSIWIGTPIARGALARDELPNYRKNMGQQHRVRTKQKRRKAYLKRKKATRKPVRREPSKPRIRKEPAPAAE